MLIHVLVIGTSFVLLSVLGAIIGVTIGDRRGALRGAVIGPVCGACAWGLYALDMLPRALERVIRKADRFNLDVMAVFLAIPAVLLCVVVYRVIRQTPDTSDASRRLRRIARLSLALLVLLVPVLGWSCWASRKAGILWDSDRILLYGLPGAIVVLMGALPWLVDDRRRAAGPDGQLWSRWDTASKWLSRIGGLLGPLSLAAYFSACLACGVLDSIWPQFAYLYVFLWLLFFACHVAAPCLFALGVVIQTYRWRWHAAWTIPGAIYLVVFWGLVYIEFGCGVWRHGPLRWLDARLFPAFH